MNEYVVLDNIAVRVIKKEEKKTPGGIIIPETVNDKDPIRGEVVMVGKGRMGEKMQVNVGDIILFNRHIGTKIKTDAGEELIIMRQSEITFGMKK